MLSSLTFNWVVLILYSRQRDEVRQNKMGKVLEWDQDKPTLDADGA